MVYDLETSVHVLNWVISLSEIIFESFSIDAVSVALFKSCHIFLFLFVGKKKCFLAA